MQHPKLSRRAFIQVAIAMSLAILLYISLVTLVGGQTVAQEGRPPSLTLIEEAYQRGELDYETALVYKVYTVFVPYRLPPEYQSDTPARSATLIFLEVSRNWEALSPQTQALLTEFLKPPPPPGQVTVQAQSRPSLEDEQTFTTTHFVIHYTITGTHAVHDPDVDVAPANGVADYVDWVAEDLETVWSTEIGSLGWLEPPPDTGEGGDSRYDLYLRNLPAFYGYTDSTDGFVGDNPNSTTVTETNAHYSFMALENDFAAIPGDRRELIQVTIAHEFNHAIQVGYDEDEALWLMEATATWMEDEIYDDIDDNYQYLHEWFDYPDIALDTTQMAFYYGRWIFTRYVAEHHGGQATVRRIWEHAVTADNLDAVDAALVEAGASFDAVFPPFATANYVLSSLPENAPYTYEEAAGYRAEVGSVEVEAYLPYTGTTVTYNSMDDGNGYLLEQHAAEYWVISATTDFTMTFQGNPGIDYAVQGALRQGDQVTVTQVPLVGQQGTWMVNSSAAYDQIGVIVSNKGSTDDDLGYDLTFQLEIYETYLPLVLRNRTSGP
jgi:hypothetical protein